MSLFNELQNEIIENPKQTGSYKRVRKKKNEEIEVKTEKQIRREMKEKLPEKEYKKRYANREYEKRKDKYKERYKKQQEEVSQMLREICDEIWPGNDLTDWDKYYKDKFERDDKSKNGYRYAWWASRLKLYEVLKFPTYKFPIRIPRRNQMDKMMDMAINMQNQAYLYLKPHMDEVKGCFYQMSKKQLPYDFPVYMSSGPLRTLAENGPVNKGYIFLVYEGMRRGKYMCSEMYLGKNSFIFGDVIVTQTGHLFRISLDHNLPRLTKDTVEDIHKKRMEWKRDGTKEPPPIYILRDAYLIKVKLKEEFLYYIVPT